MTGAGWPFVTAISCAGGSDSPASSFRIRVRRVAISVAKISVSIMTEKPEYGRRRKAASAARQAARHLPRPLPGAFFLTDPERIPDPGQIVSGLPKGWGLIYRHFGIPERLQEGRRLMRLCRRRGICLLIAADPHLARRLGADGVHWPERMERTARLWRGRFRVQTMSVHAPARFARLAATGVNALIFSTVFPSQSPTASRPTGAIGLRRIARAAPIRLYALGGISPANAQSIASQAGLAAIEGWSCFATTPQGPDFRT